MREIWATGTTANYTAEELDALMANGVLFTYKGNTVVNTRTSGSSFYFSVINWQSISTPRWEFYIVDHYKNITENNISGLPSIFVPKGVNGKTYANDNEITLQAGDISAASGWSPSADTDIATKKYVDDNAGGTQQQADWNEADNTQPDYIKNKPTIPTFPTATNTGDVIYWNGSAYVAGAITNVIPNADNNNY